METKVTDFDSIMLKLAPEAEPSVRYGASLSAVIINKKDLLWRLK